MTRTARGWVLPVRVTPKGGRNAVLGYEVGDAWVRVKVAAPPVDGAANEAVCRLVAEVLDIAPSRVLIGGGESSRVKRLLLEIEVDPDGIRGVLEPLRQAMAADATDLVVA